MEETKANDQYKKLYLKFQIITCENFLLKIDKTLSFYSFALNTIPNYKKFLEVFKLDIDKENNNESTDKLWVRLSSVFEEKLNQLFFVNLKESLKLQKSIEKNSIFNLLQENDFCNYLNNKKLNKKAQNESTSIINNKKIVNIQEQLNYFDDNYAIKILKTIDIQTIDQNKGKSYYNNTKSDLFKKRNESNIFFIN